MRPSGVTPVASITIIDAPESASVPRCIRCQSVIEPSTALYWHIGATVMRFASSSLPIENGVNSLLLIIPPNIQLQRPQRAQSKIGNLFNFHDLHAHRGQ